jgi:hypothetical protein
VIRREVQTEEAGLERLQLEGLANPLDPSMFALAASAGADSADSATTVAARAVTIPTTERLVIVIVPSFLGGADRPILRRWVTTQLPPAVTVDSGHVPG